MFSYRKPELNMSIEYLNQIYPRPSPYIDSNLHKFGSGPAATMLPVQNNLPVQNKPLNLDSSEYFKKKQ